MNKEVEIKKILQEKIDSIRNRDNKKKLYQDLLKELNKFKTDEQHVIAYFKALCYICLKRNRQAITSLETSKKSKDPEISFLSSYMLRSLTESKDTVTYQGSHFITKFSKKYKTRLKKILDDMLFLSNMSDKHDLSHLSPHIAGITYFTYRILLHETTGFEEEFLLRKFYKICKTSLIHHSQYIYAISPEVFMLTDSLLNNRKLTKRKKAQIYSILAKLLKSPNLPDKYRDYIHNILGGATQ